MLSDKTKKALADALKIQVLIKPLEEKLKVLKDFLKDAAQSEGVKEDGNFILENGVGRACVSTVIKVDQNTAIPYLKEIGRDDLFKVVETTTSEQLKQIMGEEDITTKGYGTLSFACKLTPAKKK